MTSEQSAFGRVWKLLALVESHPRLGGWLREADVAFPARQVPRRGRVYRQWLASAALVMVAIGVAALGYWHFSADRYETQVGEQRDVILADGSKVTLNTNSAVVVRYSKSHRYLLLERGEALFTVAHNSARPFDVVSRGIVTRALGTEFNVDVRGDSVTVSVLEGAVQVSTPDGAGGPVVTQSVTANLAAGSAAVAKGQAIEFRSRKSQVVDAKADLKRIEAWRRRRLEFSDTPLSEAVEEFNRYSTTQVVIGTPELDSVRVTGVFRIGDADGFLYSLREALGVEAHESANEVVLMKSGASIRGSVRLLRKSVAAVGAGNHSVLRS